MRVRLTFVGVAGMKAGHLLPGDSVEYGSTFTIGSEESNDLRITTTRLVSRRHARIEIDQDNGVAWLSDLGSTNGTYYASDGSDENLQKLDRPVQLEGGELIAIAIVPFRVSVER